MKVQCVLCDEIEEIADNCFVAKRLRNQQSRMFMCETCHNRITTKTEQRIETGNFHLYRKKTKNEQEYIK